MIRSVVVKKQYEQCKASAVKIQSQVRRHIAQQNYNDMKKVLEWMEYSEWLWLIVQQ